MAGCAHRIREGQSDAMDINALYAENNASIRCKSERGLTYS